MSPIQKIIPAVLFVVLCIGLSASPASPNHTSRFRLKTDHFFFYASPAVADAELRVVAARAESLTDTVRSFLSLPDDTTRIRYTLFETVESKGLATGYTLPAHALSGSGEVFAALESGFEGESDRVLAGLIIRRALGDPKVDLLEMGLGMYFTENWRGKGYRYWAARISRMRGTAELALLLDNEKLRAESQLISKPLAGAFVSYLIETFGRETLLAEYATWRPTAEDLATLGPGWRKYLEVLYDSRVEFGAGSEKPSTPLPGFQKGFCHAHEGYQIHNGYASCSSDEALERLSDMGVNSISLSPYSYIQNPHAAAPLPFLVQPGAENDESVIHASLVAKRLGMTVMLKPHLWVHGGWPGDIEMPGEEEWSRFFGFYWSWIRHYALLAEMYDIGLLCVGVELSRATVGREDRWRRLFERVREIYRGKITYAANWGYEFEKVEFWDSLDFIGINCYYPLSEEYQPSDRTLSEGVERTLDVIDSVRFRHGKRVIITEVGFTSSPAPWIKPYSRDRRAMPDEEAQARCYKALIDGVAGRSDYAGIYWWKWPSYLKYGGPRHSGFTPNGKMAEKLVERWFSNSYVE